MDGSRIWFNSKVSLENNSIQKNILGFWDLRLQLHNNLSTITHCERFNIWKELWIEFWAENRWFWEFFMPVMDNLNFRAKNRGFFCRQLTIFSVQIQVQKSISHFFFQFLTGKFKFTILFISLKIEFLDTECQLIVFP